MPRLTKHFETQDAMGHVPDLRLIGRQFKSQQGIHFIVGGWSWDADRNRWMIGFKRPDSPVVFMRLPEHFFEMHNGKPRFIPIQ